MTVNEASGKLTRSPSLSRDCRVAHSAQHDLRKLLPPSRATQSINTRHSDDEQSSRTYLVRCSTSDELMGPTSLVWFVDHLKMGDGGDYEYH